MGVRVAHAQARVVEQIPDGRCATASAVTLPASTNATRPIFFHSGGVRSSADISSMRVAADRLAVAVQRRDLVAAPAAQAGGAAQEVALEERHGDLVDCRCRRWCRCGRAAPARPAAPPAGSSAPRHHLMFYNDPNILTVVAIEEQNSLRTSVNAICL